MAPECDAVFKARADVETVQATALHVSNSEGVLATGDNLSEAQIVQEIVSELIDNVIAAVEAKVPVVKEILDGIHLEGDKLNDKANNCMLEWDDDNAVNPKAASEAEIIQEVVNELIDNVTATVEAKPTVVRETSNALHLEGDKFNGTAHECMLKCDNESAINYPEAASEAEIIQEIVNELVDVTVTVEAKATVVRETSNALHLEGNKFNGTTLEFMLECDNDSAINPEAASEAEIIQEVVNELIDNVTATVEAKAPVGRETSSTLHLKGDKFNGTTPEFMLEWDNDGAIIPEPVSEAEIIQDVVNELVDVTATVETKATVFRETSIALRLEGDKFNGTTLEFMLECDDDSAINSEAASEAEIIREVVNELIDNVTATLEAKAPVVRETLNALHLEDDTLNGTAHECMLDWDNESAINYAEAASEAEIIQDVVNELVDVSATVEAKAPVVRETSNALHLEGDKFNSATLEFMLECDDHDGVINPEAASEAEIIQEVINELIDNVTATVEAKAPVVRETLNALHLEGDKLNGTAHEFMLEWDNDSAINPEAASEAEIIQEVVNELIDNVTATVEAKPTVVRETSNALHLEGDKFNGTTLEFMLECDNDSAMNPEAASEAEIIQEIVNELIDNVTATVEVKPPVVRETLNVLHLEGDKFNATTLEFMLEWDDEGANQPENASDAQIAQGVINSLVDDVVKLETQGVPVVLKSFNENLNDLSVEDDKLDGTAHECTEIPLEEEIVNVTAQDLTADVRTSSVSELESVTKGEDIDSAAETIQAVLSELIDVIELESDDTVVFESARETLNDIPAEVDKPSSVVHEFTLEWEDVSALEPERAEKFQSVTEVTEIFEQEEVFSDVEHEFSAAEVKSRTVSGLHAPELAFESHSVTATSNGSFELNHSAKITHESVPAKKDGAFFSDGSNQVDNGRDVSTISDDEVQAAEVKAGNIISNENSLELKSVSEIVQFPLRIKDCDSCTHAWTANCQLKYV